METWLKVGLVSSLFLSVLVISVVSWDKNTVLSPYNNAADEYSMQQLTEMRNVIEDKRFQYCEHHVDTDVGQRLE